MHHYLLLLYLVADLSELSENDRIACFSCCIGHPHLISSLANIAFCIRMRDNVLIVQFSDPSSPSNNLFFWVGVKLIVYNHSHGLGC